MPPLGVLKNWDSSRIGLRGPTPQVVHRPLVKPAPARRRRRVCSLLWPLAFAVPAVQAQTAFVQSSGLFQTSYGTSAAAQSFASTPKVGDTVIVTAWSWNSNNAPTITATDNFGNTYTSVAQGTVTRSPGGRQNAAVLTAPITTTGTGFKVTVNAAPTTSQIDAVAIEYSGVGTLDQSATNSGLTSTASVTTPSSTVAATELVVTAMGVLYPWSASFGSITPTSGYTVRAVQIDNYDFTAGGGADKLTTTTGVQSATWTGGSAFTGWVAAIATFRANAAVTPDHYALTGSPSQVNCQPATVTVTAHSAAHAAVATTDTIALSTSTGHGDWSLTTGSGSFVAGAANSGAANYTFVSGDSGAVVLSLRDTYPETVTINVTDGAVTATSGSALSSEDSPITFAPSGFRFTNASNTPTSIATQVAGVTSTQNLALQAIRTDTTTGACTAAFASGSTVTINLAYQCNNPTSCVAGQTFKVTNNGTTTAIAANPAAAITTYTAVPMKFSTANAEAPLSLTYSDTGLVTLAAKYFIPLGSGAASANSMSGSGQFVVQPYALTLSSIKRTSDAFANPGAATASGTVFIGAGQSFTATLSATNLQVASTPNFGQEISPTVVALTPNLVLPSSGHDPAVTGSFAGYANGAATGTAFAWPEVGVITLTPSIANFLGSGAVTGTASGNVGRFVPNNFATSLNTPVFGTACSVGAFSYVGQPFTYTVAPVLTVTALALGGATTQNYTGSLFRLTNASVNGRTYTPTPASPALALSGLPATSVDPVIADLTAGAGSLSFSAGSGISFSRATPIAPFSANISLSINVTDLDGITATNPVTFGAGSGIAFSTSANQYYGRLSLGNAPGSELLDLPMSLTAQYYVNAVLGFATNTFDSCTTAPTLSFSNYQSNLISGETCVRDSGTPGVSGVGCPVAATSHFLPVAAAGGFNLILAAPGAGNSGAVTVTATAPTWLQYLWNASSGANSNPAGMASFGVFPGPASRVYQREVY